ncbi:SAM-dependent RNA methyltransferase [Phlyctochytrium arcticum]|nr:SAM-dependent RNA methyltransferase [Phlyctochytrium arcticum]
MVFKYIVEHMEPELDEWSELEYTHISQRVGPSNLYLTHLQPTLLANLPAQLIATNPVTTTKAVGELDECKKEEVILLDPAATEELKPEDGEKFGWLLFGGILGDDPPRDRTSELRRQGFTTRHLGPVQMTTDTAVLVARKVIEEKIPLSDLRFVDRPEVKLGKKETVELPFRYLVDEATGGPKLPPGLIGLLKKSNDVSLI